MIFPDMWSLQKITRPLLLSYSSKKSTYNWIKFSSKLKKLILGPSWPQVTFLQKLGFLNFLTLWLPNFMQKTGFDLTFKKWFLSFPNKNNCQTDLNVGHYGWPRKNIFHSRSPKMVLNNISFIFLSYWTTSKLHLILEDLKNWIE